MTDADLDLFSDQALEELGLRGSDDFEAFGLEEEPSVPTRIRLKGKASSWEFEGRGDEGSFSAELRAKRFEDAYLRLDAIPYGHYNEIAAKLSDRFAAVNFVPGKEDEAERLVVEMENYASRWAGGGASGWKYRPLGP